MLRRFLRVVRLGSLVFTERGSLWPRSVSGDPRPLYRSKRRLLRCEGYCYSFTAGTLGISSYWGLGWHWRGVRKLRVHREMLLCLVQKEMCSFSRLAGGRQHSLNKADLAPQPRHCFCRAVTVRACQKLPSQNHFHWKLIWVNVLQKVIPFLTGFLTCFFPQYKFSNISSPTFCLAANVLGSELPTEINGPKREAISVIRVLPSPCSTPPVKPKYPF